MCKTAPRPALGWTKNSRVSHPFRSVIVGRLGLILGVGEISRPRRNGPQNHLFTHAPWAPRPDETKGDDQTGELWGNSNTGRSKVLYIPLEEDIYETSPRPVLGWPTIRSFDHPLLSPRVGAPWGVRKSMILWAIASRSANFPDPQNQTQSPHNNWPERVGNAGILVHPNAGRGAVLYISLGEDIYENLSPAGVGVGRKLPRLPPFPVSYCEAIGFDFGGREN